MSPAYSPDHRNVGPFANSRPDRSTPRGLEEIAVCLFEIVAHDRDDTDI